MKVGNIAVQWGTVTAAIGGSFGDSATVTFPCSFLDTAYSLTMSTPASNGAAVLAFPEAGSTSASAVLAVGLLQASQFSSNVSFGALSSAPVVAWTAIGRWQ